MTRHGPKAGGKRAGAGRKPRAGVARDVGRSLWLTPGERDAQDDAAKRAGLPWGDWIRGLGNAAAAAQHEPPK